MRSAKWVGDTSTLTLPALLCVLLIFFTVPGQRTLPKMKTEKKVIKADHAFEFSMSCDHHMNDSLVLIFFWAVLLSILRDTTIGDNVVWFASRVDLTFNVNLWQCCAIILIWKYRRVGTAHLFVGICDSFKPRCARALWIQNYIYNFSGWPIYISIL